MAYGASSIKGGRSRQPSVARARGAQARVLDSIVRQARIGGSPVLWIWEPPTPGGQKVALVFSTIVRLKSGSTIYFGAGGLSEDEHEVDLGMSAGTALELVVTASVEPGAGSYRVRVRKNGFDTAMVVTLTGSGEANRVGLSNVSVPFAAKDRYSMRLESLDGAPDAIINVALKYQFAS